MTVQALLSLYSRWKVENGTYCNIKLLNNGGETGHNQKQATTVLLATVTTQPKLETDIARMMSSPYSSDSGSQSL